MQTVRLSTLKLEDVGPFTELEIEFRPDAGLSLICGDNGIGKTTILESIAAVFSQGDSIRSKRRQSAVSGKISVNIRVSEQARASVLDLGEFSPTKNEWLNGPLYQHSRDVINVRAAREIVYAPQSAINRDPVIEPTMGYGRRVADGLNGAEIKQWFSHRYLLKPHADTSSWTQEMKANIVQAETFFSLLDSSITLDRVDIRTFDIILSTPSGQIPFEYMSSGFRSAFFLLLGIVKEIEYRGLGVSAKDFSGLILIDELDLHLHPSWQRLIGNILKQAFPAAQIIATTHSPHVIQSEQAAEVVALVREDSGLVRPRVPPSSKYGYAGWSVEEVLKDIMGIEETETLVFREAITAFDTAMDSDDAHAVFEALSILRQMLHPHSPTRKLIEIQAAPYVGAVSSVEGEQ